MKEFWVMDASLSQKGAPPFSGETGPGEETMHDTNDVETSDAGTAPLKTDATLERDICVRQAFWAEPAS